MKINIFFPRKLISVLILYQIMFGQVDAATPKANCTPLPDGNLTCAISFNDQIIYNSKIRLQNVNQNDKYIFLALHTTEDLSSVPGSVGKSRPKWTNKGLESLFDSEIESFTPIYNKITQKQAILNQCAFKFVLDENWFNGGGERFFVRGHFAPNGDFSDAVRNATFHDFNAAPQWQKFNNGYWKIVEQSIRDLVRSGTRIKVLSGSYDQVTCLNEENQPNFVYLYDTQSSAENAHFYIPIPKVFYKVVKPKNPIGNQNSILIVTINHPTMTKGQVEYYFEQNFCEIQHDICDILADPHSVSPYDWFKPSGFECNKRVGSDAFKTVENGYTYACEATDDILKNLKVPEEFKSQVASPVSSGVNTVLQTLSRDPFGLNFILNMFKF